MQSPKRTARLWVVAGGVALAGFSLLAGRVDADVVHLKDGATIEGRAVERGGSVEVQKDLGTVTVSRKDVAWIERRPVVRDVYAARLAALPAGDAQAARRLAAWAAGEGLQPEARALLDRADQADVDARLARVAPGDAAGTYAVTRWARARGMAPALIKQILEMVIAADPDHQAAREELGHERFRGAWLSRDEVARRLAEEEARAMRQRGYVRYEGRWARPEELQLREAQKALAKERAALARDLEAVRSARAELEQLRKEVAEQFAAIQKARQEIAQERADLAARAQDVGRNAYGSAYGGAYGGAYLYPSGYAGGYYPSSYYGGYYPSGYYGGYYNAYAGAYAGTYPQTSLTVVRVDDDHRDKGKGSRSRVYGRTHGQQTVVHGIQAGFQPNRTVAHRQRTVVHGRGAVGRGRGNVVYGRGNVGHRRPPVVHRRRPSVVRHRQPTVHRAAPSNVRIRALRPNRSRGHSLNVRGAFGRGGVKQHRR